MKILKLREPIAKKEHKCMLCGGIIEKGEQYERQTCVYDGSIYDWICHKHCSFLASKLDMYDYCDDDGLDSEHFSEMIDDYMHDNHYDELINDIPKDWRLDLPELTMKIVEEDFIDIKYNTTLG